ncbi:MAG TPA: hypothetical protein VKE24_04120, partial [Candidatus Acidoferrales bacterium]|nr:hypothetical protein [Candidatus Acidoferrales bacterium]
IEPLLHEAGEKLAEQRTVKLGRLLKESANAEFFVLLSFTPAGARVEEVRFVSGSDKLRPFAEALRSARYPVLFPDDTPTKLVRRGILSCLAATGDCFFVLLLPDFVNSVN